MKKFLNNLTIKSKILTIPLIIIFLIVTSITIMTNNLVKNKLLFQMKEDGIKLANQLSKQAENNDAAINTINKNIENRILSLGDFLYDKSDTISNEYLVKLAKTFQVNEINIVDAKGNTIYCNLPEMSGFIYDNTHPGYCVLSGQKTKFIEDIRKSTASDDYYKYGYISRKNGGMIQVGILANEINKLTNSLEPQTLADKLAKDKDIVYVVFIDKNLKAVAHSNKDRIGITLTDEGSKAAAVEERIFSSEFDYKPDKETAAIHVYDVLVPVYNEGVHIGAMDIGLSMEHVNKTISQVTMLIIAIGIIALAAAAALLYSISKNITKPLGNLVDISKHIAKGEFDNEIVIESKDEIGILAASFREMSDSLRNAIGSIKGQAVKIEDMSSNLAGNSEEMTSASNEVATAIGDVTTGAAQQASDLMEVVHNIEDLASEIDNIQNKLLFVKNNSDETENKANIGKEQIDVLLKSIQEVKEGFDTTTNTINNLNSSVSQIGNITDVINGISEQTNLLALNAAIEAARAGEYGKGFAVVADEIKKLAEQSKESTQQIQHLIESISVETEDVINTSDKVKELVQNQVNIVENNVMAFEDILKSIAQIVPLIDDTYVSLDNTIKSKNIVSDKATSVSSVAQETSASSEEIAASSEEMLANTEEVSSFAMQLNEVAAQLKDETNKFKV
ncbi:methyl-accepting chemotaxis protein [Clostridium aestuarii]|uniref:Methyl-accepting chemotaxis protein n=1 Tax=Clostridium aestuarii TaxID=338193 RepID=A0ABT4CVL5_9CLOT|nr:methyl-accepting chemotaxis protein [Clostridium aestuarii]